MVEEAPQELRASGQAPPLTAHVVSDLIDGVWSEIRKAAVLEVAPEQFHGVEFRRVGREPDDMPARMGRQPRAHEAVLVGAPPVPDQDHGPAHVTREVAEKPQHLRTPDVHSRVQRQREGELSPTG